MTLAAGAKVGAYEILAAIGAGGMGEVYRARDSKLGRDVALKVLPEAFAGDAERMARFQREAKSLASLIPAAQKEQGCRAKAALRLRSERAGATKAKTAGPAKGRSVDRLGNRYILGPTKHPNLNLAGVD
jgi:serine/threonine protein kinase